MRIPGTSDEKLILTEGTQHIEARRKPAHVEREVTEQLYCCAPRVEVRETNLTNLTPLYAALTEFERALA